MEGLTLKQLRSNPVLLGYFCVALKDSGTLYERIAGAVNERDENRKGIPPWVTPDEVRIRYEKWKGSSGAKDFAAKLAERALMEQETADAEAAIRASKAARRGMATKRLKNPAARG